MKKPQPLTPRLARRLKELRQARGWSLDDLADRSAVSRATLSRLEHADVSPTAEVLGKLCAAYGLPMSRLMTMVEDQYTAYIPAKTQEVWQDPASGFERRSVSPPATTLAAEVLEGRLKPGTVLRYDAPPRRGQEHHLILQSGALMLTIEGTTHNLQPGDCLRYRLYGPSEFRTPPDTAAQYLLFLV